MSLWTELISKINVYRGNVEYRKNFRKKFITNITPRAPFDLSILRRIGRYSYGDLNVLGYGDQGESLEIGEFVSIAADVLFLVGGEHRLDTLSTFPFDFYALGMPLEPKSQITKGPIVVHDDVWIGTRALILSNVEIGQGAVIGAGSVVAKSIPPYAVAVGNPARVIKYRFPPEIIEILCKRLDYTKLTVEVIQKLHPLLKMPLNKERLEEILSAMGG